ncbi:MAG: hypothetical protein IJF80_06815 [Clostridia bacterium]|nr:hypothetical protein [Clostridia bacterium]
MLVHREVSVEVGGTLNFTLCDSRKFNSGEATASLGEAKLHETIEIL